MKRVTESTTEQTGRKEWTHTVTLECGHTVVRVQKNYGGACTPPVRCKCPACETAK